MALSSGVGVAGGAKALPSGGLSLAEIVDAAIDQAPEAVRRRVILQAVDWSGVDPARVAGMLANLGARGLALPRELATAVLIAGHALPADAALGPELRALSDLNRGAVPSAAVVADLVRLAEDGSIDPKVAGAIVKRLVALGADAGACALALAVWRLAPEVLAPVRARLASHIATLPALRMRLAGFSTTGTLAADLGLAFGAAGRNARIVQSDFGAAVTALLQPDAESDLHIVLVDLDGLAAPDWRQPPEAVHAALAERADSLAGALSAFAARSPSPLLINSIPAPSAPTAGLLDGRHICGMRRAVHHINERLLAASERHGNIVVVDADHALADIPSSRHRDPRLWFYGRVAYSAEATRALAGAFARTWALLAGGPAKVLALDLDDTLWGGTYGEDGIGRLVCGEDFPGNAFQAFQQECLRLKHQGMLLVALSKNNPEALSALSRHPGMVLKPGDFVAAAVNWEPKPENIRRLATELNLGLDSFVLLDDSPHEREAMRRLAPEVIVPELPADPALRPSWLRRLACTWPVRLTKEDARRSEMYAAERGARALKASAVTVEDYLRGLDQRLTVSLAGPDAVARIAQMHQRTNQFNLTTRRLTEADIAALADDPERGVVLMGRVADKLGDHGIVVAATVAVDGAEAEIGTFLMSCRVIGREIERGFLTALLTLLSRRGVKRAIGRFAATARNAMVRDFYGTNGFTLLDGDDTESRWIFDLHSEPVQTPFVSVILEA
jgi:FkbH-like protein